MIGHILYTSQYGMQPMNTLTFECTCALQKPLMLILYPVNQAGLGQGHLGAGEEIMMNREVFKFPCHAYSHNQDRSTNFFWGCNTFRTFNVFLSSHSLSRPSLLVSFQLA